MTAGAGFGSDNWAGAHPDVLAAVAEANSGQAHAYGDDAWTARAQELFRAHFGDDALAFPVFNGTAANVLGLEAVARRHHAVICTAEAHLNVDECGAPERIAGVKLLTVPTPDAKLTVELAQRYAQRWGDQHAVQPRVVSITQSTELGTRYSVEETRSLADFAHAHGMVLHVDGARLANAAAGLGLPLRALTTDAGVDIVSFGGTKNGLLFGEAVVFLDPGLAEDFLYIRKGAMQLASKQRFISAQFVALLEGDLWQRNAAHANAMAQRLADGVRDVGGLTITQPVQANGVFAILPPQVTERLRARHDFYVWNEMTGEVRWLTAWDTAAEDVDTFVTALLEEMAAAQVAAGPS